jgi:hypothetical protein
MSRAELLHELKNLMALRTEVPDLGEFGSHMDVLSTNFKSITTKGANICVGTSPIDDQFTVKKNLATRFEKLKSLDKKVFV